MKLNEQRDPQSMPSGLARDTTLAVAVLADDDLPVQRHLRHGRGRRRQHEQAESGGDGDEQPSHSWNSPLATTTALPATSTRSMRSGVPQAVAKSVDGRPTSAPWEISISSPDPTSPWRTR